MKAKSSSMTAFLADNTCPHWVDSVCGVASDMAGCRVPANPSACAACTRDPRPREPNAVTASLSLGALHANPVQFRVCWSQYAHLLRRVAAPPIAVRLQAIRAGTGVGSQIWLLLESLGVRHTPDCVCLTYAERLNAWGTAGCRLARAEILQHLRDNAGRYGWSAFATAAAKAVTTGAVFSWLKISDPYGSLVDEAIRRAASAPGLAPVV
jgi:hypothetical protein